MPEFGTLVEQAYAQKQSADSQWHVEPSVDEYSFGEPRYHWHASEIAGCPRRAILKRQGVMRDPSPANSVMAFEFGHTLHRLLENTLLTYPALGDGWSVLHVEKGGAHPTLPLKARPDALLALNQKPIVFDLKSEAAIGKRLREARGKDEPVSYGHKLQITCGAIVAEARGMYQGEAAQGLVLYISRKEGRNDWTFTPVVFEITAALRRQVLATVAMLEDAWSVWQRTGQMPQQLPQVMQYGKMSDPWQCRPRGTNDPRGKYCEVRRVCFDLAADQTRGSSEGGEGRVTTAAYPEAA